MKSLFLCIVALASLSACQKSSPAPTIDQVAEGEELYGIYCASCHEIDNGIGPRLTKDVVATRVNAQFLFNYNKRNMPYEAGGTLTDAQYWSVTAYMLQRDGFIQNDLTLSSENAASILLTSE